MNSKKMLMTSYDCLEISDSLKFEKKIAFNYEVSIFACISVLLVLDVKEITSIQGLSNERDTFIYVSILKRGCFRFSINSNFHPNYLREKLNLDVDESISISYILNNVCDLLKLNV